MRADFRIEQSWIRGWQIDLGKTNALVDSLSGFFGSAFSSAERASAGKEFKQEDAESIDIRSPGDRITQDLFWGHVSRGTSAGHNSSIAFSMSGDTEITEIDMTAAIDHDIGRFNVTVNDVVVMGVPDSGA